MRIWQSISSRGAKSSQPYICFALTARIPFNSVLGTMTTPSSLSRDKSYTTLWDPSADPTQCSSILGKRERGSIPDDVTTAPPDAKRLAQIPPPAERHKDSNVSHLLSSGSSSSASDDGEAPEPEPQPGRFESDRKARSAKSGSFIEHWTLDIG
jgi:hypothetical protein